MNIPPKYLAVAMAFTIAGGAAGIGEVAAHNERQDTVECVGSRVEAGEELGLATQTCVEVIQGDSNVDGMRDIALLSALIGTIMALRRPRDDF